MKKTIIIFLVILFILFVLSVGFYFVLKSQLSTESINKKIYEIAEKNGYELAFDNARYKIGLFTISAELDNVILISKNFYLVCKKVNIMLNPFMALQKKFELNNVFLDTPVLTVLKVESRDSIKIEKKESDLILTTNLKIKSGEVKYDTLSVKSINGQIFLKINKKIDFTSNLSFISDIKYLNKIGTLNASLSGYYENLLTLKKLIISADYFYINASVEENNKNYIYKAYGKVDSLDFTKNLFFKNDSLKLNGNFEFFLNGKYDSKKDLDSQYEFLLDSFEISPRDVSVNYKKYSLCLENESFINKQRNSIVFSTNWIIDSLPMEFIIIADYSLFTKDTLRAKVTMKGLHAREITKNIKDFKWTIDTRLAFVGNIKIPLSSMTEIDSLIQKGNYKLTSGEGFIVKDSTAFAIKSFVVVVDSNDIKGSFKVKGMGLAGDIFFTGDWLKKELKANTLLKIDISGYNKGLKGEGEVTADAIYNFNDKTYLLKIGGTIKDVIHKSINDTFDITFDGFSVENGKNIKIQKAVISGENIDGIFSNMKLEKSGGMELINGKAEFAFLNYDSLFIADKSKSNQTESKPPVIDKKYKGEISAIFDRMIFKSEDIRNGELVIKISDGNIFVYPVKAELMKGKMNGNIEYYSQKNGLIKSNVKSEKIDINEFLTKNRFVPFTIGAKVDMNSDLEFMQNKVKETVKGTIEIKAGDGWLLMPDIISNISNVLKLPLSDTFYFDDMYGEFNIDSQCVRFDDFVMEKNGRSLNYGGRVDFAKNMKLTGKYIIDMKIADIGLLERILRMADYKSDSIVVDFEVNGTYLKPKVSIKYNSVEEYLKNRTNDAVNNMIDELNNLFKF